MNNFDIVKYLKEHKLGSYGMFNGYVDLKHLKEAGEQLSLGFSGKKFGEGDKVKLNPKYIKDKQSALNMAGGEKELKYTIDWIISEYPNAEFEVVESNDNDRITRIKDIDTIGENDIAVPTAILVKADSDNNK